MKIIKLLTFLLFPFIVNGTVLINKTDLWKYKDDGTNQGTIWRTNSFNDSTWLQGAAELGYGDAPTTTLQSGKITYYFRKTLSINSSLYQSFTFNLRRDDGIIVYLNGIEVYRNNLSGTVSNTTLATNASDDGSSILTFNLPSTSFINGINVIAVEVHNTSTSSSDITFELELVGNSTTILPTITRGAYMIGASNSTINIQWKTNVACNSEIRYATSLTALSTSPTILTDPAIVTDHTLTLQNLQPNTKYFYSVGIIGTSLQSSTNNYFYTAPINGSTSSLKFWVTGDFGDNSTNQRNVRDAFLNNTSNQVVNGWLWLGDNAYSNGTDLEYQNNVFNVYGSLFNRLTVYPAPGNHDYAQSGYLSSAARGTNFPYFNIFNIPTNSGTEKYYSWNYGNVHFISLDSYGSYNNTTSTMYNWLRNDLINNTQTWTVVYFHHAPYSKGSHNSDSSTEMVDMRNNIIPLLEQYGVDLVLSGHSHIYERSKFIKGHFGLETSFNNSLFPAGNVIQNSTNTYTKNTLRGNGTIYVVCGVSGRTGGTTQSGYPHNAMQVSTTSRNGSLILDINGNILSCKFLTTNGSIYDQFTITKTISFVEEETVNLNRENYNTVSDTKYYDMNGNFITNDYGNLPKNQIILVIYKEGLQTKTKKIVRID